MGSRAAYMGSRVAYLEAEPSAHTDSRAAYLEVGPRDHLGSRAAYMGSRAPYSQVEPSTHTGSRAAYLEVGGVCPLSVLLYLIPNSSEDSATREGHMCPQGPGKGYQDQSISDFRASTHGL